MRQNIIKEFYKKYSNLIEEVKTSEELSKINQDFIKEGKQKNITPTEASKEFAFLISRNVILESLENGGVNNWEWYAELKNV